MDHSTRPARPLFARRTHCTLAAATVAAVIGAALTATPAAATLAPAQDGSWRFDFGTATSPVADGYQQVLTTSRYTADAGWGVESAEMVRAAASLHAEDDDFGQAGTLVRLVLSDIDRDHLVSNVTGHLRNGVTSPVLERAVAYWRSVDKAVGDRIATNVGVV